MLTSSQPNDAERRCSSSDLSLPGRLRDEAAGKRDRAAPKRYDLERFYTEAGDAASVSTASRCCRTPERGA